MLKAFYADVIDDDFDLHKLDTLSVNAHSMEEAAALFDEIAALEFDGVYLTNYRAVEDIAEANEPASSVVTFAWAGEVQRHVSGEVIDVITVNAPTERDAVSKMFAICGSDVVIKCFEYDIWAAFSQFMVKAA